MLHITLFHNAVIPPPKYGGTERVLYWLCKALVSLGHRVTLIAKEGSRIPGVDVIALKPEQIQHWENEVPKSTDLIHLWSTPDPVPKRPFLVTIEGNGKLGEVFHSNTVFVSKRHAENHGSTHFVYNGIDPESFEISPRKEDTIVFLAKAQWKVKNLKGAMEIARTSGLRLEVMGSRNWPWGIQKTFSTFNPKIHYHGMVGDEVKRRVLAKAKALIFPVLWHEPFGIAITEALASGCAVFGTPYGSLPEIVTPETGILSESAKTLTQAIRSFKYNPDLCRARVYQGFTHLQMAEKYLNFYRLVLEKGTLPSEGLIQYRLKNPPETLLPWQGL